jgi:hypothetical protein
VGTIYILGMSHLQPVLDGCSSNGIDEQLPKIVNDGEPRFVDWDIKPGSLPGKVKAASIYIQQHVLHWGYNLAEFTGPGVVGISAGYRKLLDAVDKTDPRPILFTCMHGEEYHHMCIHPYNAPPDFELSWRPDLPIVPDRQIVPFDTVERSAQFFLKKARANFYSIRTFYPHFRIINLICPPPSDAGEVDMPATHYVRLKNYLVYTKVLRDMTDRTGIESIAPPEETLTELGTLKKEYAGDMVHGNRRYGELVVAQMARLLEQDGK